MSEYQPRGQGGWPAQPPAMSPGPRDYPVSHGQGASGEPGYGRGAYGPPPGRTRRRRRRHPGLILLVVLAVLAVVAVIADQVARSYAQSQVAQQVQQSAKLSAKPSVSIGGWPFVTQILSHDLKQVRISANNVTDNGGKVRFDFSATATGVHLNSSLNGGTADRVDGQVLLPFSAVASAVSLPTGTVTLSADPAEGPNAVKVDLGVLGSVTGTVKLASPSKITIQPGTASGFASFLGGASGQAFSIDIPKLPAGLVVRSVTVTSQGIVATAAGTNTPLTQ
ncbi:MAG TPA: DUF2993 domain-containing protein [Trebonia sp.]